MTEALNDKNIVNDDMIIADYQQGSDEWLTWRSQGVTATDIPVILGLSPYKTVWQLWAEKVGRINAPDISRNPNVIRGNQLEDIARQLAEKHCGEILLPICGEYGSWPILRASFDGLDSGTVPHEFKAPSNSVWDELFIHGKSSATYALYEAQVHVQCLVSGSSTGKLMFFIEGENGGDGKEMIFDVKLTNTKKNEILKKAQWFWDLVQTETEPPKDPERDCFIPADGDERFIWEAHADAWRANNLKAKQLKIQLERIAESQKEIQKEMTTLMKAYKNTDVAGVKISRFTKKGRVDYVSFLTDWFPKLNLDELELYRAESRNECRFTLSEDELVNMDVKQVITTVKPGYF